LFDGSDDGLGHRCNSHTAGCDHPDYHPATG
jgi:hypothetical protein